MAAAPDPERRRLLTVLAAVMATLVGGATLRWLLGSRADTSLEAADGATSTSGGSTTQTSRPASTSTSSSTTTPTSSSTTTTEPTPSTMATFTIPVICRDAWGAQAPTGGMEEHSIDHLTVHHTAVPISSPSEGPGQLRSHQRFHQESRGWPDLAYHFMIDPGGHIYEGRDVAYRGDTATEYDTSGHFLVCVDGEFDSATPNEAQLSALVDMLAYGAHSFRLDPSGIGGHRDYASTSCPGANIYSLIESGWLADQVNSRLSSGMPSLSVLCGEEGLRLVGQIETGEA